MRHETGALLVSLVLPFALTWAGPDTSGSAQGGLPHVTDFQPRRYLGKWYEVARLPTPIQPDGTLAMAEYSEGEESGPIRVRDTAFDRTGRRVSEFEGQARLAEGDPPGRFRVAFGPVVPQEPNYHVIHVDPGYRFAVVGVPDRKSLWILAREVPVEAGTLAALREIARASGCDVSRLVIAPWESLPAGTDRASPGPGR